MPTLGPEFQTFERVDKTRLRMVEAKERAAAHLAHTLLPETVASQPSRLARLLGRAASAKEFGPLPTSSVAIYDHEEDGRIVPMAAFFSAAGTGCLFTRVVTGYDESGKPKLGPLQPRAAILKDGYHGYPVVALDKKGYPVFPESMMLDERDNFINGVQETLSIIRAQNYTDSHPAVAATN